MKGQLGTFPYKTAVMICGFILGIVILAKGQHTDRLLNLSGIYVDEAGGETRAVEINMLQSFIVPDVNGNEVVVSVNRLIDVINVINTSTYYFEVHAIQKDGNRTRQVRQMEVVYNSTSDECFVELTGINNFKRISRI